MNECWFIVNRASGSHDLAQCDAVGAAIEAHLHRPVRYIALPEDSMPGAAEAIAGGAELIVVLAGDGTVSAAVAALEGWRGALLVLPGGTMNLLSRKLHGDREVLPILADALARRARAILIPLAEGGGLRSLVGIIAGPTAAWGEVREDMRRLDLAGLLESVPQALQETLRGDPVSIDGIEGAFQAIFVDPRPEGLHASGILAGTAGELLQHGWAWLRGDFRDGPRAPLVCAPRLTLRCEGDFSMLVDGEQAEAKSPCTFTLGRCGLRFIATR